MKTYEFSLTLRTPEGVDLGHEDTFLDLAERIYEVFDGDVEVQVIKGALRVQVERAAESMVATLVHALRAFAGLGLRVVHFGPEPLVNAAQIAERLRLTRERVGQLLQAGELPSPLAALEERSPLYRWSDVVERLRMRKKIGDDAVEEARAIERVNAALTLFDDTEKVIETISA